MIGSDPVRCKFESCHPNMKIKERIILNWMFAKHFFSKMIFLLALFGTIFLGLVSISELNVKFLQASAALLIVTLTSDLLVKYTKVNILYELDEGSLKRSEEHTSELQSRENLVCR